MPLSLPLEPGCCLRVGVPARRQRQRSEKSGHKHDDGRSGTGELGRRIGSRRRQLGLSHEELAARAGVSVPYLTYLDTYPADVTMSYLMRLPNALEMSPAAALGVDCRRRLASAARRAPF